MPSLYTVKQLLRTFLLCAMLWISMGVSMSYEESEIMQFIGKDTRGEPHAHPVGHHSRGLHHAKLPQVRK